MWRESDPRKGVRVVRAMTVQTPRPRCWSAARPQRHRDPENLFFREKSFSVTRCLGGYDESEKTLAHEEAAGALRVTCAATHSHRPSRRAQISV
jgi:hypothetical protein